MKRVKSTLQFLEGFSCSPWALRLEHLCHWKEFYILSSPQRGWWRDFQEWEGVRRRNQVSIVSSIHECWAGTYLDTKSRLTSQNRALDNIRYDQRATTKTWVARPDDIRDQSLAMDLMRTLLMDPDNEEQYGAKQEPSPPWDADSHVGSLVPQEVRVIFGLHATRSWIRRMGRENLYQWIGTLKWELYSGQRQRDNLIWPSNCLIW